MPILDDEHPSQEYLGWVMNTRLKFLLRWCKPESQKILDIGKANALSAEFGKRIGAMIVNTDGDLDFANWEMELPIGGFQDVMCLEVLEHLANPLHFLCLLRQRMAWGGRFWITTPKCGWHWLWNRDHFIEYDRRRLRALLNRAGFQIETMELTKSGWLLRTFWRGIRPCIRAFFRWSWAVKAINVRP